MNVNGHLLSCRTVNFIPDNKGSGFKTMMKQQMEQKDQKLIPITGEK
jgi:hypothetical protein